VDQSGLKGAYDVHIDVGMGLPVLTESAAKYGRSKTAGTGRQPGPAVFAALKQIGLLAMTVVY
jgi:hypothetical protein